MTAREGFPRDVDPFALDAGTAERLVTGAVDVADAPPEYRAVAATLQGLRREPGSAELAGEAAAVEQIAAAFMLERRARPAPLFRRLPSAVARLTAAVVVASGLCVTGALASAGALPEPAQNLASTVLGKVGISVPSGGQDPAGDGPPHTTSIPGPSGATGFSPGASEPGVTKSPPGISSPTAPSNGKSDGTPARGTPSNEKDGKANKEDGQGGAHAPDGTPEGGNGNGDQR